MTFNSAPIGMFDSGFGGLTVLSQIQKYLPNEDVIYFGDNQRAPYGNKSAAQIISYNDEIVEFMINKGVKAIVIACNTSTSFSIEYNRSKFDVPFVSLIENGLDSVSDLTKTNNISVFATQGTINSGSFNRSLSKHCSDVNVHGFACNEFVPIIESDMIGSDHSYEVSKKYIDKAREQDSDLIILGCTHYPLMLPLLKEIAPDINYVDPAVDTAKNIKVFLNEQLKLNKQKRNGNYQFYTSGDVDSFKTIGEKYLGSEIGIVNHMSFVREEQYV